MTIPCRECGRLFQQHVSNGFCSLTCQEKFRRVDAKHKRRELERNGKGPLPSKMELHSGQAGMCAICSKPIDLSVKWPHPQFASYDHIVPLSQGGEHNARNVQLAHIRCNQQKWIHRKKPVREVTIADTSYMNWRPSRKPLPETQEDIDCADRWDAIMARVQQQIQ